MRGCLLPHRQLWRTRVAEGEEAQRIIIQQIQAGLADQVKLQNKVNALEGVLGEHSFIFTTSNKNPRQGEFNLQDGGMNITNSIDSADYIALSNVDANGKNVTLTVLLRTMLSTVVLLRAVLLS